MSFVEGELYERTIETPAGRIDVIAEIYLYGPQLELGDIAVYPNGSGRLAVSPSELLTWARYALAEIAEQGFEELRVTGTRLSGARPGRRVSLAIRLRRGATMSQTRITAASSLDQEEWDHVLAQLRVDGFSPIESIKVTRAVLHVRLGEAKRLVHTSRTWSDAREEFEDLQAAVSDATARLQA